MQFDRIIECRSFFEEAAASTDLRIRLWHLIDGIDALQEILSDGAADEIAYANHLAMEYVRFTVMGLPQHKDIDEATWKEYIGVIRWGFGAHADKLLKEDQDAAERFKRFCSLYPISWDEVLTLYERWR